MSEPRPLSRRTLAAQALGRIDERTRAIVPPIHLATTFERDPDNLYRSGNVYGRPDNETVREAEAVIGALEGAAATLVFGSGMSAAIALFLGLGPGTHVIAPGVMYWALRAWLANEAPALGLSVDFVDTEDLPALARAVKPGLTRLVWLETPSNPLWGVSDIEGAARIAHAAGAALAVDSTCATPIFTRPIALGADVVMHSATKYLNGHSDVIAGALCFGRDDALCARARKIRQSHGLILHPFEAFLLTRGLRTLDLRVRAASDNAMELASRLSNHAAVSAVLYPGLPHHPGHDVARRQMKGGFGGMLSIRVRGGPEAAIATAARVRLWKRATSLGGVESLIEHRASIEGAGSPCPPDLLRLSAGVEDVEDLWLDIDRALAS
jgi:cystathionine gamma-synthase